MRDNTELKPKMAMFCEHYARIDSATYGEKKASALAAGYSEGSASNMASRLCNENPVSIARIEAIYLENAKRHKGRLLSHLEYQRIGAVKDKKWDAANTSVKLQAQIFGYLLADSAIGTGDIERKELTEQAKEEAIEFAEWRLLKESRQESTPKLPAETLEPVETIS